MKKTKYFLAPVLGAALLFNSGCLGSFALTKKSINFVKSIDNSGIISHIAFWLTSPIHATIFAVDIFFLNFLEFWTGANPIAMAEGESDTQIVSVDGVEMKVTATKNKMILEPVGESSENTIEVDFLPESNSAIVHSKNGSQIINLK